MRVKFSISHQIAKLVSKQVIGTASDEEKDKLQYGFFRRKINVIGNGYFQTTKIQLKKEKD